MCSGAEITRKGVDCKVDCQLNLYSKNGEEYKVKSDIGIKMQITYSSNLVKSTDRTCFSVIDFGENYKDSSL